MRAEMRNTSLVAAVVCGAALLASPRLAAAQPVPPGAPGAPAAAAEQGTPFQPCNNVTLRCLVRAVGDFNGDHKDDVIVEQSPGTSGMRMLTLYLGPFTAPAGHPVPTAGSIEIMSDRAVADLSVADVNRDGLADLVLPGVIVSGKSVRERVAVIFGRPTWPDQLKIGRAARGDLLVERTLPSAAGGSRQVLIALTAAFGDVNGDGRLDLVLASDALNQFVERERAPSEVAVMLGAAGAEWRGPVTFRADTTISGLGRCAHPLAAVADVTGDDRADLMVRQCPGEGLPDKVLLVGGQAMMPQRVDLPGDPLIVPPETPGPPATPEDRPTPRVPRNRGYLASSGGGSDIGLGQFDPGPLVLAEDLTGDGLRDVAFGFGGRVHVFDGGPDMAERLAAGASSRILVNVGFGAVSLSRQWRAGNLMGAGTRDLALMRTVDSSMPGRDGHGQPLPLNSAGLMVLPGSLGNQRVVDLSNPAPSTVQVATTGSLPWATGDFDGDGVLDVLVGTNPAQSLPNYLMFRGPLHAAPAAPPR